MKENASRPGGPRLFAHATVITMDPSRRILTDGGIAVLGDRILEVEKSEHLRARYPGAPVEDLQGQILLPGLIDAHVHLAQGLLRGSGDDLPLMDWLTQRIWPMQGAYTPADGRASARLCLLEMIRSGTTTFVESMLVGRYGGDGIAQSILDSGMRGMLAKVLMEAPSGSSLLPPGMIETREGSFREAQRLHEAWHQAGDGRLQVWLAPRWTGLVDPELMRAVVSLARKKQMRITMHFLQSGEEYKAIREKQGMLPVEFLDSLGLTGPEVLLIHATHLEEADLLSLRGTGTHLVHCPLSNMKLAMGRTPVPELLAQETNVALGCDGAPCNNTLDMFLEMRAAALLHKAWSGDPTVLPAETVLEMATINGARAIGLEGEIGSLEAGKKADFIVVDPHQAHSVPHPNPVSAVVYSLRGSDVVQSYVDGRCLLSGGTVHTLEEAGILEEAGLRLQELLERTGLSGPVGPRWPCT